MYWLTTIPVWQLTYFNVFKLAAMAFVICMYPCLVVKYYSQLYHVVLWFYIVCILSYSNAYPQGSFIMLLHILNYTSSSSWKFGHMKLKHEIIFQSSVSPELNCILLYLQLPSPAFIF